MEPCYCMEETWNLDNRKHGTLMLGSLDVRTRGTLILYGGNMEP